MASMNVSLPDSMRQWVETQIEGGRYANASDYIRDLIRHDQDRQSKHDALVQALIEGEESGVSPRKVPEILDELKREWAGEADGQL